MKIGITGAAGFIGRALVARARGLGHILRRGAYSIDKVRALGYRPAVDLDEGMARCAAWLRGEGAEG